MNPHPENTVLATPDQKKGAVRVNVYEKNKTFLIQTHNNQVSAMCINFAGTLLATASDKGTLVRIWSLESGEAI